VRWLGVSLLLSLLPLIGSVPWAGPLVLIAALGIRAFQHRPGRVIASLPLRLAMVALGAGGTWLQQGSIQGLETGTPPCSPSPQARCWKHARHATFRCLRCLAGSSCPCSPTLDQSMGRSLFALGVFTPIAIALVSLRSGRQPVKASGRVAGTSLAQALPLVVLLFLLFPRGSFDIARRLSRVLVHQTGMSSTLDPGSVAELAKTEALAFYATIENAPVPDYAQRYWRRTVLWQCDGLRWERGGGLRSAATPHAFTQRRAAAAHHAGAPWPAVAARAGHADASALEHRGALHRL